VSTRDTEHRSDASVDAGTTVEGRAGASPEPDEIVEAYPGAADTEIAALAGTPAAAPRGRRKKKGILFWAALVWIVLVVVSAITATVLPIADPNEIDITNKVARPGEDGYLLGADGLGRDILARLMYGARVSLIISVSAVTIGTLVGGTLGMTVGYFRGWLETVIMALVDILLAFPGLVLLLFLVAVRGQSLPTITVVIGFLSIPVYTRVARATTLAVAQREFVLAAKAMGATHRRVIFREIMPNVVLPVAAFGLVALGVIIVLEGTLAFLNLSVQPPDATWGSMIAEGKRHLQDTIHVALMPSLAMFLTVLSLNFVGDSLRSRFDVRESNI
jgi:peptide/nickel transport system permease protein